MTSSEPLQGRATADGPTLRGGRWGVLVLFGLSGAAALTYQVVWVRMLGLVFGVTTLAVSTVLTAFMAGLALGSLLGGRFVDRRSDPLRVFGVLQLGIAVFALCFPFILDVLSAVYVQVYRDWALDPYVFSLFRFALAFAVLLVPTSLMGATLPAVSRYFVRRARDVGADMGALYGANNLGAVVGALATGFVLVEFLGVHESAWLAAAVSAGVGLAAFALHGRGSARTAGAMRPAVVLGRRGDVADDVDPLPRHVVWVCLVVFGLEGFTSLAYEVVWVRILSAMGLVSTLYTYSLVVATFIAGLSVGSFVAARLLRRRRDLLLLLAALEVAIGLSVLALLPLFREFGDMAFSVKVGGWPALVVLSALWIGGLLLVPTTLMGATFPVVSRIYAVRLSDLGTRVGRVGFLDTVGSIFGAFAGGFVLIPLLGMQASVIALALVNLGLGALVVLVHPAWGRGRKAAVVALTVALGAGAWLALPHRVFYSPREEIGSYLLYYEEDVDATITVRRIFNGEKVLEVNRVNVAGTGPSLLPSQVLQGHVPVMIYESVNGSLPERVLQVGLGSGHTFWCLSQHALQEIHCVELVPGVLRAARKHFGDLNHDVFEDLRTRVFFQDARTHILATERKYDLIMDDSIHPSHTGSASLYSRDFFAHCRDRLRDGGVMSVWLPLYKMTGRDLAMVCKAFQAVYPHASLWFSAQPFNMQALLVGSTRPMRMDFGLLRSRFAQPAVQRELASVGIGNVWELLACMMLDEEAMRAYTLGAPWHTDAHPRLAFSAPRARVLGYATFARNLGGLLAERGDVLPYVSGLESGQDGDAPAGADLLTRYRRVNDMLVRAMMAHRVMEFREAIRLAEEALSLAPRSDAARSMLSTAHLDEARRLYYETGAIGPAMRECLASLRYDAQNVQALTLKGRIHAANGELSEAVEALKAAVAAKPTYVDGRMMLAGWLGRMGRGGEARAQVEAVLRELPENSPDRGPLERLAGQLGR